MSDGEGRHVIHANGTLKGGNFDAVVDFWSAQLVWDLGRLCQIDGGEVLGGYNIIFNNGRRLRGAVAKERVVRVEKYFVLGLLRGFAVGRPLPLGTVMVLCVW